MTALEKDAEKSLAKAVPILSIIVLYMSSYTEFEEGKIISDRNNNEAETTKSIIDSVFTCINGMLGIFDITTYRLLSLITEVFIPL